MGVDFSAVMDHQLEWAELYGLADRLNASWSLPDALEPWVSGYVRDGVTRWTLRKDSRFSNAAEELFEVGHLSLDGPAGFGCTVFKQAIEVNHLARWWSFLHDPAVQSGLREACSSLATMVRARHLLFLPDSFLPPARASGMLFEGKTVGEALAWLRSEVGGPLSKAGVLLESDDETAYDGVWYHHAND